MLISIQAAHSVVLAVVAVSLYPRPPKGCNRHDAIFYRKVILVET